MFAFLNSLIHRNEIIDNAVFFLAETLPYILLGAAFLFLFAVPTLKDNIVWVRGLPRRALKCIHAAAAVGISYGITEILKRVLHYSRPFEGEAGIVPLFTHSGGDSFPSGHATAFAALATIMYFHHRPAGVLFWIGAVLISLSRVIAGVHFPIDILGGFIIGGGIGLLMNKLWRKLSKATSY